MPTISDRLINVTGTTTEHENIYVRSYVRAGEDNLITSEQERIPVGEDGLVTVTIESGPAVLIIQREATVYSRADIIPLWVPEYDTTIREAIELGKTHHNMDGDTAQDLVEQLLSTITGAVADGLTQIEEAVELIIGEDGVTIDLSDYATTVYVDEQIEQIELTPGRDGKDGQDGEDGISPHIDQVTGNWFIGDTDTGVKAQGQDGQDGQDGQNGQDGISPHIDQETGNWFIGEHDTGVKAQGQDGQDGVDGQDGRDGQDGVDGKDGQDGEPGASAYETWLSAGNTGTEADFLSSLKGDPGQDGQDGRDGEDGQDGQGGASAYETWLSAGNTGTEADFLSSLKGDPGQDGQDGQDGDPGADGISPHIDQISGNWHIGDYDTGVKAQGPKGDPGDGSGGGTSAVLKTTMGVPQDTEGVEPGEIRIETFSGLTWRAKGSFGMIPADMAAVYPVGQDPTGMPGLEQLPAGMILTDDGTNFWQLQIGGEVKKVQAGGTNYAQELYGYGTMPPGTAFKIDRDDDPDYPAGLYIISDEPPVTRWEQFTMSPDALLTYRVNLQNTMIQDLEDRVYALENPTE